MSAAQDTQSMSKAGATVEFLWSKTEALTCRETWNKLHSDPNVDWDFYWHTNKASNCAPCILKLSHNNEVKALWIGRIERGRVPIRLGYFRLGGIDLVRLNIVNGGLMGDDSEEAYRLLLHSAYEILPQRGFDVLRLSYVPTEHPLFVQAMNLPGFFCRDWSVKSTIHWRMTLPASFDEFLKRRSKKHRYWLNRLPRVLEAAYPGQIRMKSFDQVEDVDAFCRDADIVAKLTYQHTLGEAFRADENYNTRCRLFAEKGLFRGYILYVAGQPRAYWMATICRGILYLNLTGYDPQFRKYEVGTILLMKLLEDHCGRAEKVDFGHGGAVYKERFGDESLYEASVHLYRFSAKALFSNFVTGINAMVSKIASAILTKLGLLQKLKTFWRLRLMAKPTEKEIS